MRQLAEESVAMAVVSLSEELFGYVEEGWRELIFNAKHKDVSIIGRF